MATTSPRLYGYQVVCLGEVDAAPYVLVDFCDSRPRRSPSWRGYEMTIDCAGLVWHDFLTTHNDGA